MKKVFPVIVVLITLSLLGIIVIQVSWFKNVLLVQQERLKFKVDLAGYSVAQDLSKQVSSPLTRLKRKPNLRFVPDDFSFSIIKPPLIAQRYTTTEIADKIRKALSGQGLGHVNFEFAITSDSDDYIVEMQSQKFTIESLDTNHFYQTVQSILPEAGTEMEGLSAYEHLWIVIPDFKTQVWESLTWMVVGSILFTIIIIAAFYLTVKTMLNQRKLSKIKSDFINNMTHELKTPLATISLAVDALGNEKVEKDQQKRHYLAVFAPDMPRAIQPACSSTCPRTAQPSEMTRTNFKQRY